MKECVFFVVNYCCPSKRSFETAMSTLPETGSCAVPSIVLFIILPRHHFCCLFLEIRSRDKLLAQIPPHSGVLAHTSLRPRDWGRKGTVDATKARDRINPVSLKVTKFSHTKVREIFKRYQVSLSLAFLTTTVHAWMRRYALQVILPISDSVAIALLALGRYSLTAYGGGCIVGRAHANLHIDEQVFSLLVSYFRSTCALSCVDTPIL